MLTQSLKKGGEGGGPEWGKTSKSAKRERDKRRSEDKPNQGDKQATGREKNRAEVQKSACQVKGRQQKN